MSPARQFLVLELVFLLGVATAASQQLMLACVGVVLIVFIFRVRSPALIVALLLVFGMGWWRWTVGEDAMNKSTLRQAVGHIAMLQGVVDDEVHRSLDRQRFILRTSSLRVGDQSLTVEGRVMVPVGLYPEYRYGDRLRVTCSLVVPEPLNGFDYADYLALSGIAVLCRQPRIAKERTSNTVSVRGALFSFKGKLVRGLQNEFPEPLASLAAGILLGARQGLSDDLEETFRAAGLSHIIALSGYNITILATAIMSTALAIGLGRRRAFWAITAVLVAFVVMTGAAASIVRAGVMGFLVVLARHVGRASRPWYALVFAGTVMVAANPRVLLTDVGFQLSFAATAGLFLLSEPLARNLFFVPERLGLREGLATTLSATFMTLPLLIGHFGRWSLVGPLVNLLVVPLIPLVMLLSFFALIPGVGSVAATLAHPLLVWVVVCAEWFAGLPWSSVSFPSPPAWATVALYLFPFLFVQLWRRHRSKKQAV